MPSSTAATTADVRTKAQATALGTALAFLSGFVVVSFGIQTIASAPGASDDNRIIPHQATLWSPLGRS